MSLAERPPPPLGPDWKPWGERLTDFLTRTKSKLSYYLAGESAGEDGVLLWDRTGYPVVSKNGEWRQIKLAGGSGSFASTVDVVAASPDTAYAIPFDLVSATGTVTIDAADSTKIIFAEAGVYSVAGNFQLLSSTAAVKTIYLWTMLDGTTDSVSVQTDIKDSGQVKTVGVSFTLTIAAGSYLQIKWAVSNIALRLKVVAATAFAPTTRAAQVSITRAS